MAKYFNVTGTCFPHRHYMADISKKFAKSMQLVEHGDYFAINRPSQFGKTTMLYRLADALQESGEYLVFNISFEGIDSETAANPASFCRAFVELLAEEMRNRGEKEFEAYLREKSSLPQMESIKAVSGLISDLAEKTERKLILLIDEVDKSSNNSLFIDFLAMLRNKYLRRHTISDRSFHSVILAGLYDVKTLKSKIRPDDDAKYNSPWNIAADFNVVMELQADEIVPMLEDYCQEKQVQMDTKAVAEALFYYSSGYPFLVSAMCKWLDEEWLPNQTERVWTVADVETAADRLIRAERSTTNFDSFVELKMWRGEKAHKKGLAQLSDYLVRQNQDTGFLVIFEQNEEKTWKKGWIRSNGKRVFAVWV
jgi:Predicted AAA-ATPase